MLTAGLKLLTISFGLAPLEKVYHFVYMKEKISFGSLLYLIPGILFLVSGIAKLFPVYSFELLLVNQELSSWELVPWVSRGVILAELILGVGFFLGGYYRKFYLPASMLMLLVFNIHLIYSMLTGTGGSNCGCFGELIPMTPIEALIKNLLLMALLVYLWFRTAEHRANIYYHLLPPVILAVIIFTVFPVTQYQTPDSNKENVTRPGPPPDRPLDPVVEENITPEKTAIESVVKDEPAPAKPEKSVDDLPKRTSGFAKYKNFNSFGTTDLDSGSKLVALLSLDCDHCMETARAYITLKKEGAKLPPFFALFFGEEQQVEPFFELAGGTLPWMIIPVEEFFPLLTQSPPRVVFMKNGNTLKDWDNSVNFKSEFTNLKW